MYLSAALNENRIQMWFLRARLKRSGASVFLCGYQIRHCFAFVVAVPKECVIDKVIFYLTRRLENRFKAKFWLILITSLKL